MLLQWFLRILLSATLGIFLLMVVLYVGKRQLRMTGAFNTPSMRFEFRLLDMREFDGEPG